MLFYDPKVNQGPQVLLDPLAVPNDLLPKVVTVDTDGTVTSANFVDGTVPPNKFVGPSTYFLFTFNQPVLPSPANLSNSNLSLRFESDTTAHTYSPVPTTIELIENCVNGLAKVKITPIGLLPAGRKLRLVVAPTFSDIKGETNFFAATVPPSPADEPTVQPPTFPDYDAIIETFESTIHQDPDPGFTEPPAAWGPDGGLEASFTFGGQTTDLEMIVTNGQEVILDTSSTVLNLQNSLGSPVQASFQGGNIYLRKLTVKSGGKIRGQGPNPLRFFVNETVSVESSASILCVGTNAQDINTLLTCSGVLQPWRPRTVRRRRRRHLEPDHEPVLPAGRPRLRSVQRAERRRRRRRGVSRARHGDAASATLLRARRQPRRGRWRRQLHDGRREGARRMRCHL